MHIFYIKQMTAALAARPSSEEISGLEDSAHAAARLLKLLGSVR